MKTLDDRIIAAVASVVKPCVPDLYTGEVVEYCSGAEKPGNSSAASSVRAARTALMQKPESFARPEEVI